MTEDPFLMTVQLRQGEVALIRRALRVYAHTEQEAIQAAVVAGDPVHAADVRRQVEPRVKAAGELMARLLNL